LIEENRARTDPRRRQQTVQVKIAARHGSQLSDDARDRIRQKAERLLHFFDRITMIEVTVDLERKDGKWVEFRVDAEHKHDFVAHDSHEELLAAVDLAVEKIKQQIVRYKEKIQNHHRGDGTAAGKEREEPGAED
jgi:ribosome hibernation promoting factor